MATLLVLNDEIVESSSRAHRRELLHVVPVVSLLYHGIVATKADT